MRIGVNTLYLVPGEVGGSERYLRNVLQSLAQRPDLELVLFTNQEADGSFRAQFARYPTVEFQRLPVHAAGKLTRLLHEFVRLPRVAGAAHVDLLWCPAYTALPWAPCPQVVTVHDMQYRKFPQDFGLPARLALRILVPWSIHRCARVLAVSEFAKREILACVRVPTGSIHVTLEAADVSFAEPLAPETRRERLRDQTPGDGPYLLCVANTYPHKNVPALVEAFTRIADRIPHRLVLVGIAGRGEALVQKSLQLLPSPDRCVRLHHLRHAQLVALYQGADLFVFPSLYEGFGLPVLEAMKAGTPVIATRRGPMPEVGGECIEYCDGDRDGLAQAMLRALAWSPTERSARITAARCRADTFTWEKTAQATLHCFRAAVQTQGRDCCTAAGAS